MNKRLKITALITLLGVSLLFAAPQTEKKDPPRSRAVDPPCRPLDHIETADLSDLEPLLARVLGNLAPLLEKSIRESVEAALDTSGIELAVLEALEDFDWSAFDVDLDPDLFDFDPADFDLNWENFDFDIDIPDFDFDFDFDLEDFEFDFPEFDFDDFDLDYDWENTGDAGLDRRKAPSAAEGGKAGKDRRNLR